MRFDYGSVVPWVRTDRAARWSRSPGPTRSALRTPVETRGEDLPHGRRVRRQRGRRVPFVLDLAPSHLAAAGADRPGGGAAARRRPTGAHGSARARTTGEWRDAVLRSLITLKAPDLRPDRRHRRGGDHLAAGGARRRAQLGLPLLLAARRDLHAATR